MQIAVSNHLCGAVFIPDRNFKADLKITYFNIIAYIFSSFRHAKHKEIMFNYLFTDLCFG